MKIKFVTITVDDIEESLKFYKEVLHLEEVRRFSPQPGVNIAFLKDKDNGMIELIEHKTEDENDKDTARSLVSIGVGVENLNQCMEMLKNKGIEILRGPIQVPSGEKFLFIKDPNGVEIEFIEGF